MSERRTDERPGGGAAGRTAGWAPIVYARIRHHDHWWRAVPADPGPPAWAPAAIRAAVAAGRDLDLGPRFLAAHRDGRRLLGVVCLARDLGTGMDGDGQRPLYCFVGWLEEADAAARPAAPPLDALRAEYPRWAGEEYRRWVGPDWLLPPRAEPAARISGYGPPPWEPPSVAAETVPLRPAEGVQLWPPADAGLLWASALTPALPPEAPVTAVIGLRSGRAVRPGVTHATAEDATHRQVLPAKAAPPPGGEVAVAHRADPRADQEDGGYVLRVLRTARRLVNRRRQS